MVTLVATAANNKSGKENEDETSELVGSQIDDTLRALYNGLVEDEIPTRFQDLIRKLREQETSGGSGDS